MHRIARSIGGSRLPWLVVVVAAAAVVWQLSSSVGVYAFNVHATVQDTPPGIAQATEQRGSPPLAVVHIDPGKGDVIYLNTPIDYETVFAGQTVEGHFKVLLTGVEGETPDWIGPPTSVTYRIHLMPDGDLDPPLPSGTGNIRPYITLVKTVEGIETEPDYIADGQSPDWYTEGTLTLGSDVEDLWLVTFHAPEFEGFYNPETDPEAPGTTVPVGENDYAGQIEVAVEGSGSGSEWPTGEPREEGPSG